MKENKNAFVSFLSVSCCTYYTKFCRQHLFEEDHIFMLCSRLVVPCPTRLCGGVYTPGIDAQSSNIPQQKRVVTENADVRTVSSTAFRGRIDSHLFHAGPSSLWRTAVSTCATSVKAGGGYLTQLQVRVRVLCWRNGCRRNGLQ